MVPPASGLGWQTSAAKRALAAPRVTIASRRPAGPDKSTLSSLAASGSEPGWAGVNVVVIPRYILRPVAVQFHLCATYLQTGTISRDTGERDQRLPGTLPKTTRQGNCAPRGGSFPSRRSKYAPAEPEALSSITAVQNIRSCDCEPLRIKALGQG